MLDLKFLPILSKNSFNQWQSEFNVELILKVFHVTISNLIQKLFSIFLCEINLEESL